MKSLIVEFIVDDEDADLLNGARPMLLVSHSGQTVAIYKAIANRMGIKDEQVDHVNRMSQDNTRKNLRGATRQQNIHNQSKRKSNTSGYIGVSYYKLLSKWRAKVHIGNKTKHLGYFDNPIDAAKAYDEEIKTRGEFAVLNFPRA